MLPICWAPARVREVINPEAESVADSVFRAVHTDFRLRVAEPVGTSFQQLQPTAYRELLPHELLAEFLRPERPHAQIAIIGRSGSGKSHLIHWMNLHIRSNESRLVLLIPKAGTSLRAILEKIISNLPREDQADFIDELNRAGDSTVTSEGQKHRLLNNIALAIREDTPRLQAGEDAEVEQELIKWLPAVFEDPYLREQYYLKGDSIVASVVDHIFASPSAYCRTDERFQFGIDDLPTGGSDFTHASSVARSALNVIYLDEARYKPLAIDIVNRNLSTAITWTLSFSGDRLIQLMNLLREHLKREGRELVLLIEDFARLQGIDRALLQALLEQGDSKMCKLRWAIAVTTGFFESVAATVYTRMTYFVDMDRSIGSDIDGVGRQQSLANFAARYLNAVRIGRPTLDEWHSNTLDAQEQPPNKCTSCLAKSNCHSAFGVADGDIGLYPFTERSLWEMASRVDEQAANGFNPRVVQNSILAQVLDNHAPALAAKAFPPKKLLESLGGASRLRAQDRGRIATAFPVEGDRLITALELWGDSDGLKDLPEGIRDAFSLPQLPEGLSSKQSEGSENLAVLPAQAKTFITAEESRESQLIERWARGELLDQTLAQTLRIKLFPYIVDAIDWDAIGLERSYFAAATGARPFRQTSITFLRQSTQVQPSAVTLQIPGPSASDAEMALTAAALQGLLEAERNGGKWDFSGGMESLSLFLELLSRWTSEVTAKLNTLVQGSEAWSPVRATTELLAIGAALSGRLKENSTFEDQLIACFQPWPTEISAVSSELRSIYKRISDKRERLIAFLRAVTSASKGGRIGAIINSREILVALKNLHSQRWALAQERPQGLLFSEHRDIAELYAIICRDLAGAAAAERTQRISWLSAVREAFGMAPQRALIVEKLNESQNFVTSAGIAVGSVSNEFRSALEDFKTVQFDDAYKAFSTLDAQPDALACLSAFGRGRLGAVSATERLIEAASSYLQSAESRLKALSQSAQAKNGDVELEIKRINEALESLVDMFDAEEGGNAS